MKKFISMLCALAMVVMVLMPMNVNAEEGKVWNKVAGEETWTYSDGQGTELIAKIKGTTLYIQGKGEIPSFDFWKLGDRPWNNKTIYSLEISKDVTSIGAYAFAYLKDLHNVSLPVSAFIEDPNAFTGATKDCYFAFQGMNITSRNIGNVPYNSLDSIAAFMQKYNGSYQYRLDNYYLITWVQNSVKPKIVNLAPYDAVTTVYNPEYPVYDYNSTVEFVSQKSHYSMNINIDNKQQGKTALEIFSIVLGDKTYVTAYNIGVSDVKGQVKYTDQPLTYKMTIPAAFQCPGREFTLIQFGEGVVNFLADEDSDDTTLTFTTNYPSTVYGLVYQDAVVATPVEMIPVQ